MATRKIVDRVDSAIVNVSDWALRHRFVVVVLSILMVATGFYFASKAQFDNSVEAFFDRTDPTYIAYIDYLEDFLSDEVTYILYRVPNAEHGPFDIDVMRKIASLTEALEEEVPFVREVTSLANVEFIRAEGDSINVDELLIDFPETQEQLLKVRDVVLSKPLYVDYLTNKDATYAAIILEMDRTSTDPLERIIYDPEKGPDIMNLYPQVSVVAVNEILSRAEYQGIEFFLTGDAPMNTAYNLVISEDVTFILLVALFLIVIVSMLLFRVTLVGILGPITVVLMSVVMTVGFVGFLGWSLGLMFSMVPTLICAVGVAQSVHILLEFQRALPYSNSKSEAVRASLKKVGGPCLMAALTTAAGFLVMYVSELRGLRELAIYSSFGVLITFVFSVTLLLVFLSGDKKKNVEKESKVTIHPAISWIVKHCIRINIANTKLVVGISAFILLFSFIGASQLKIDFNFLTEFKPHVEWRQHTEIAESVMGGILGVTYIIDTKTADGIKNVELLHALEKLQRFSEQQPLVKKTFSVTDIIKDLNQSFNGDDPSFHRIPENQQLVAQYFLVYELSGGEELEELVSLDFSRSVLEFRVEITEASNIIALLNSVDAYLEENPIPGAEIRKTGIGLMWVNIANYIGNTQIASYSLVFTMILLFMTITFGSLKIGLLSMIPNLAPVVFTIGMMGWMGIHLDYMKLLLATTAIGIAVDDTIHLISRYRSRFMELGDYQQALEKSLSDVGPALIITSAILVVSFSSYLFGDTTVMASFGILLSTAITTALLSDLFLMPAIILWLKPFGAEFVPEASQRIHV